MTMQWLSPRVVPALVLVTMTLTSVICPQASAQNSTVTAFVGARIIDGSGQPPIENGVLLVRDGRIEAVGPAEQISLPEGVSEVDVSGKTIMPGLINAHGHAGNDTQQKLSLYARYGVTTVVSLGGENASHVAIREAQDHAGLERARLYVAGPVVNPSSPEAAASDIERLSAMDVDWVKIRVEGGSMPEAVYAALIEHAHQAGLRLAAHMYNLDDTRGLLRHNVDLLAHSVRDLEVDDELIGLMRETGACISPTLTREVSTYIYESTPDFFSEPFFLRHASRSEMAELQAPATQSRMAAAAERGRRDLAMAQRNLKILSDAGIPIAMGTDSGAFAGRFPGYFEHLELSLMAEAGMAPMDIIVAATGDAARCMGLERELGTLSTGKWADFIVLADDPLEDIDHTRSLESVWIAGNQVMMEEGQ